jgi:hypothetical protein
MLAGRNDIVTVVFDLYESIFKLCVWLDPAHYDLHTVPQTVSGSDRAGVDAKDPHYFDL